MSESLVERLRLRAANRRRENSAMRRMDAEVMEEAAAALSDQQSDAWRQVVETIATEIVTRFTLGAPREKWGTDDVLLYDMIAESFSPYGAHVARAVADPQTLMIADIQRRLNVNAAKALRVQSVLRGDL